MIPIRKKSSSNCASSATVGNREQFAKRILILGVRGRPPLAKPSVWLAVMAVFLAPPQLAAAPADLELVLAVDTSSSINDFEFRIQIEGYAAAFRYPDVHNEIDSAGDNGIAVSLLQWAGDGNPVVAVDWMLLRGAPSASAFADRIAAMPRYDSGDLTAIGDAIDFSLKQFATNGFEANRQTIDLSADGRSNEGGLPGSARDRAVADGVTINGLVVMRRAALDLYFKRYVIGGPTAFVERVDRFEQMPAAVLRKLIREIIGLPVSRSDGVIDFANITPQHVLSP